MCGPRRISMCISEVVCLTYLAEELGELVPLRILSRDWQTGFLQSLAKEAADFLSGCAECLGFEVFRSLAFVCAGEEVGEELQCYGKKQFGKGNNKEHRKGHKTTEILHGTLQLGNVSRLNQYHMQCHSPVGILGE